MAEIAKVLRGIERCKKCTFPNTLDPEGTKAYLEREYTIGLYCGRDRLEMQIEELLKEQNQRIWELLTEKEHKDEMFHALEEDWKKLKDMVAEQDQRVLALVTEKDRLAEELHKLIQHCDNVDVDALLGRKAVDIRRDVPGLWCDDITFCQEKCEWKDCPRNSVNIRDRTVPHSYSVEIPEDCPKQLGGR